MTEERISLQGSFRPGVPEGELGPDLDPGAVVEMTLVLRRRAEPPAEAFAGPPLTREELAERYGAAPGQLEAVTGAVTAAGAEILSADAASRTVRIRGRADIVAGLFGTSLRQAAERATGTRRRTGELSAPITLAAALIAALGLDDRPQAKARVRTVRPEAQTASYTPLQLASAYSFPDGDGAGRGIAIVELGGGFGQDDLATYFGDLKLVPPTVRAVSVDGASNEPGKAPDGADGEVLLDIEVAGAIAPAADIAVYFAPNTDDGFVDAITQAAHASPAPTAISISWGQSEDQWTAQGRAAMDAAIADAVLLGATVTVAAGDNGSSDTAPSGDAAAVTAAVPAVVHVDFPASSPHALACGGTSLTLDASGAVSSETVWNDGTAGGATGGGVSDEFAVPTWQANVGVPAREGGSGGSGGAGGAGGSAGRAGRGVPDVAAVADPRTGYQVVVDGKAGVIGGTSAVAPLIAGLVARLAQSLDAPLGLLQPKIYAAAQQGAATPGFRDIIQGSNGAYSAAAGWDPCTGLGVPVGTDLLSVLRG